MAKEACESIGIEEADNRGERKVDIVEDKDKEVHWREYSSKNKHMIKVYLVWGRSEISGEFVVLKS